MLADDSPAADYPVRIAPIGDDRLATSAEQSTDANGIYTIAGVRPGDYQISILKPRVDDGTHQPVEKRIVYESEVEVAGGAVATAGKDSIIRLDVPAVQPTVDVPLLEPVLFVPVIAR